MELNLKGNNLLEVPESIGGLSCLWKLNLEGNNLSEVPESIGGLSCLKKLNLEGNNLSEVPESIGGLSCLKKLNLKGNNFSSLPGSLSQLFDLGRLIVDGCKKLEVLPELSPSIWKIDASNCTSLREVSVSSRYLKDMVIELINCPKLFKNVTIDSEGSISKIRCLDSSITSQGAIHQLSAFLGYVGFQTNRCEFFRLHFHLEIMYYGNSIPVWFTNRSTKNQ
ncbi:NB-ARC domains-containing protein, partial [Tanacetum coccineum]